MAYYILACDFWVIAMRQLYPKYFVTIIAVIFCCSSYSCKKSANNPSFDFTWIGAQNIDSTITFHANAPAGSAFLWNFGDGTSSTDSAPSHKYIFIDSFDVLLTVNNNAPSSVLKKIFIGPPMDFTLSGVQLVGNNLTFQSTAVAGSNCVWDFGDGGTGTGVSASHVYAAAGTYSVSLTVNNGIGGIAKKTLGIFTDPVYTNLIAGSRLFHHTYRDNFGNPVMPDVYVTIGLIDALTIKFGSVTLPYTGSTDSVLIFSIGPPNIYTYDYTTLKFNHISGSIDYLHEYHVSAGAGTAYDHYFTP